MHVEVGKEIQFESKNRPSSLFQKISNVTRFLLIKYRRFLDLSRNGET